MATLLPVAAPCALRSRLAPPAATRTPLSARARRARRPPPARCASTPPDGPDVEEALQRIQQQRFYVQLVSLCGVKGTAAVVAAKVLGLDVFGNFHLLGPDVPGAVGLALALAAPAALADAVLMRPDWTAAPPPATGEGEGWREFTEAAALFQKMKVATNPAAGMPPWQEGLIVVLAHLADEMLGRAVALTALSHWVLDRLLEADVWEASAAEQRASWFALALILAAECVRKRRSLLRSLPISAGVVAKDRVTGKAKLTRVASEEMADVASLPALRRSAPPGSLDAIQRQVLSAQARARSVAQIDAARGLADWVVSGAAFAATGNLAAPVLSSTLLDLLFCSHQRAGMARMMSARAAPMAEAGEAALLGARIEAARAVLSSRQAAAEAGKAEEATELLSRAAEQQAEGVAALAQAREGQRWLAVAATQKLRSAGELLASALAAAAISEEEVAAAAAAPEAKTANEEPPQEG